MCFPATRQLVQAQPGNKFADCGIVLKGNVFFGVLLAAA